MIERPTIAVIIIDLYLLSSIKILAEYERGVIFRLWSTLSMILDVEDVIPGSYTLEVTSPRVERKLLKFRDFERFTGKKIKAALREPVENSRRWRGARAD